MYRDVGVRGWWLPEMLLMLMLMLLLLLMLMLMEMLILIDHPWRLA